MLKRLFLRMIILLPLFMLNSAYAAEEAVKVIVLPFNIHALAELSYLVTEIPRVIGKHLKNDGATLLEATIDPDGLKQIMPKGEAGIRDFGMRNGADHVIWGSVTWIGEKFSLDAKIIRTEDGGSTEAFYEEGEGIENLLGAVKNLSRDLSVKLFKLEKVAEVRVVGNKRIEADAILRVIKTETGGIYQSKKIPEDIKAIYATGYFDDIRVDVSDVDQGRVVAFTVKEKATIRQIIFKGNKVIGLDSAVCSKRTDHINFIVGNCFIHDRRVEIAYIIELKLIRTAQSGIAILTLTELSGKSSP